MNKEELIGRILAATPGASGKRGQRNRPIPFAGP
jgi:hypothetical protein